MTLVPLWASNVSAKASSQLPKRSLKRSLRGMTHGEVGENLLSLSSLFGGFWATFCLVILLNGLDHGLDSFFFFFSVGF